MSKCNLSLSRCRRELSKNSKGTDDQWLCSAIKGAAWSLSTFNSKLLDVLASFCPVSSSSQWMHSVRVRGKHSCSHLISWSSLLMTNILQIRDTVCSIIWPTMVIPTWTRGWWSSLGSMNHLSMTPIRYLCLHQRTPGCFGITAIHGGRLKPLEIYSNRASILEQQRL